MFKSKSLILVLTVILIAHKTRSQFSGFGGFKQPAVNPSSGFGAASSGFGGASSGFGGASSGLSGLNLNSLLNPSSSLISSLFGGFTQNNNNNNNNNANKKNLTTTTAAPTWEAYLNLTAFIVQSVPDVCDLHHKVSTASLYFTPEQKQTINVFMESLELGLRRKLIAESQDIIEQTPSLSKTVGADNLDKILEVAGLTYRSSMCSYDENIRLNRVLKTLNSTQQNLVHKLFNDIKSQIQYDLPNIYNDAFSSNYQQITYLTNNDPSVMQTIGDLLNNFYKNVTQAD
jgi:hypothetical protein